MIELVLTRGRTKAVNKEFDEGFEVWDWYCSQIGPHETKTVMKQIDKWLEETGRSPKKVPSENLQNRKPKSKTPVLGTSE